MLPQTTLHGLVKAQKLELSECLSHDNNVMHRFDWNRKKWPLSTLSVVVGAHELNATEASQKRHDVHRMVLHENYTHKKRRYDIMLLRLDTSIAFNDETRPICVDSSVFPPHTKCVVTGWGITTILGRAVRIKPFTARVLCIVS